MGGECAAGRVRRHLLTSEPGRTINTDEDLLPWISVAMRPKQEAVIFCSWRLQRGFGLSSGLHQEAEQRRDVGLNVLFVWFLLCCTVQSMNRSHKLRLHRTRTRCFFSRALVLEKTPAPETVSQLFPKEIWFLFLCLFFFSLR